jgi:hypothetical protein
MNVLLFPAFAMDDGELGDAPPSAPPRTKPYAPLEKLVPAARVKWTIEYAIKIAETMNENDTEAWRSLESLILVPQKYTNGQFSEIPDAPAKAYLETYKRNREGLQLLAQPGAILVQSGEIAAWKRLKRQERRDEQRDEIRAALNLYTSSLNYDAQSYLLNVRAAERKQMIRQDSLPDVKQVIQSDMGLRYLYRNEVLTAMQQVRDELDYQLRQLEVSRSKQDLIPLLAAARTACEEWFSLIDARDVEEAMRAVTNEKSQLR